MQRYLSIVLDYNCTISKTLLEDSKYELDKYISSKFNNSNDVRIFFKNKIEPFLKQNEAIITSIEEKNKKKYRGQIVILQVLENGEIQRIKVIYKDDLKRIKEYLKNQNFMRLFILENKRYFSPYVINKIKRNLSKTDYERMINEWHNQVKNTVNYFDICRHLIKYKDLKSLQQNNVSKFNFCDDFDEPEYLSDCDAYDNYEDLYKRNYDENIDTESLETEISNSKEKTLIKKINPDQLSFFD